MKKQIVEQKKALAAYAAAAEAEQIAYREYKAARARYETARDKTLQAYAAVKAAWADKY